MDSPTTPMYCNDTDSDDKATHFSFFGTNSLSPLSPLPPGSKVFMKSELTGKFCRVLTNLAEPPGKQQNIFCDLDDPSGATEFTYTGSGFAVGPTPVTKPCSGCPLYVGGGGTPGGPEPCEYRVVTAVDLATCCCCRCCRAGQTVVLPVACCAVLVPCMRWQGSV